MYLVFTEILSNRKGNCLSLICLVVNDFIILEEEIDIIIEEEIDAITFHCLDLILHLTHCIAPSSVITCHNF